MRVSLLAILLLLQACNTTSDDSIPAYLVSLNWLQQANPRRDAQAALVKQDYRLYILAGRGQRAPGIEPTQAMLLKSQCGTQILPGSTDVIVSDSHLKVLRKAEVYAEQYNQIIAQYCP